VAIGGAHMGSGSTGGEDAVARRRSEAAAGSGGGAQQDPAAIGEREESEGPVGQWKMEAEAALTRASEDGAGATEMQPVAARSDVSD
jgi:hypothetical protein